MVVYNYFNLKLIAVNGKESYEYQNRRLFSPIKKEKGAIQEHLADKLGLSRQAVSKWERAEASPDTDNLICYNISLDELLSTDETIEEIAKKTKEKEEEVNY